MNENVCKKEKEINEMMEKLKDLEFEVHKMSNSFAVLDEKIDEIIKRIDELKRVRNGFVEMNVKMDYLKEKYVSKDEFYRLKMDVDALVRRNEESYKNIQRYQTIVSVVVGILTIYTIVKGGL